jgi:hypothetical protein
VSASTAAKSGIRNGSENRFSSLTCGDQLMVELGASYCRYHVCI